MSTETTTTRPPLHCPPWCTTQADAHSWAEDGGVGWTTLHLREGERVDTMLPENVTLDGSWSYGDDGQPTLDVGALDTIGPSGARELAAEVAALAVIIEDTEAAQRSPRGAVRVAQHLRPDSEAVEVTVAPQPGGPVARFYLPDGQVVSLVVTDLLGALFAAAGRPLDPPGADRA